MPRLEVAGLARHHRDVAAGGGRDHVEVHGAGELAVRTGGLNSTADAAADAATEAEVASATAGVRHKGLGGGRDEETLGGRRSATGQDVVR